MIERSAIGKVHDEYDDREATDGAACSKTSPGKYAMFSVGHKYGSPFQQDSTFDQSNDPQVEKSSEPAYLLYTKSWLVL